MHKHPDADAFMRACLDNPADTTTRLVFADWLEDTGIPHNTAWAHFIRAKIEADQHPHDSSERHALEQRTKKVAVFVRAKLALAARNFVAHHEHFAQLLPLHRIAVRIGTFRPRPLDVVLAPEDFARRFNALPLALTRNTLILAVANPSLSYADLGDLLGVRTVAVTASLTEIQRTIHSVYPFAPARVTSALI